MTTRVGILGAGAVGSRVARQLLAADEAAEVVLADANGTKLGEVVRDLGPRAAALTRGRLHDQAIDVLVVATPSGHQVSAARRAVRVGVPVVSTSDRIDDVERILGLDRFARERGVAVVAGAGFAPGMTCALAVHGARTLDAVDEIHVAKAGTGGPACARQHHRALKGMARDWRDGAWVRRAGGSGRELVWFPDPVSGADCYRAALPDALLLVPNFAEVRRVTARVAATRQDRFTSWLPMLSPPHPEGGVGAIRVELRGRIGLRREIRILGAVERPAVAAGAVAAAAASAVIAGTAGGPGSRGLAAVDDPTAIVRDIARRGVAAQEFEGLTGC